MKLFNDLQGIGQSNVMARNLEYIRKELGLTGKSFQQLKGPISEALERGEGFSKILEDVRKVISDVDNIGLDGFSEFEFEDTLIDKWKTFTGLVGTGVKGVQDLMKEFGKTQNPFDRLLDSAQDFKDALNLSKELGLSRQEFEALKGVIMEAQERGLTDDQIASRIEELRRDQILGSGKKDEEFLGSRADTSIKAGVDNTALKQQLRLDAKIAENSERSANSLDALVEEIRENGLIGITGSITN